MLPRSPNIGVFSTTAMHGPLILPAISSRQFAIIDCRFAAISRHFASQASRLLSALGEDGALSLLLERVGLWVKNGPPKA